MPSSQLTQAPKRSHAFSSPRVTWPIHAILRLDRHDPDATTVYDSTGETTHGAWNKRMLAYLDNNGEVKNKVDALVIHPYVPDLEPASTSECTMKDNAKNLFFGMLEFKTDLLRDSAEGWTPKKDSVGVLSQGLPRSQWNKQLWATEWGYLNYRKEGGEDWNDKWAAGLGVLVYAMKLLEEPRLTVLLHHNVHEMIWRYSTTTGAKQGLTARGFVHKLLKEALDRTRPTTHDDVWRINFPGIQYDSVAQCGYVPGSPGGAFNSLHGIYFTRDYDCATASGGTAPGCTKNGKKYSSGLIVNLGETNKWVNLENFYSSDGADTVVYTSGYYNSPAWLSDSSMQGMTRTTKTLGSTTTNVLLPGQSILLFKDKTP